MYDNLESIFKCLILVVDDKIFRFPILFNMFNYPLRFHIFSFGCNWIGFRRSIDTFSYPDYRIYVQQQHKLYSSIILISSLPSYIITYNDLQPRFEYFNRIQFYASFKGKMVQIVSVSTMILTTHGTSLSCLTFSHGPKFILVSIVPYIIH